MFLFANISYATDNANNGWGNEPIVDSYVKEEVDGFLTHYFIKEEIQIRESNRECKQVDVPIYKNTGKSTTGEVLGGAILGGVLGNQVGKGKGKDAATILGAILGADFANKKGGEKTIVGYKRTTVCEDYPTYVTQVRKIYNHSVIRFIDKNGKSYKIQFIREE
tara:strand:- start:423 stop:914 length:492 start_codon:yes stop_codon:yes gene_type:complete